MAITLRQLQAFTAVAEHGTFTKAAERLHTAQPALSQLVRELEQELGTRLFDRTTRRVELTEAGREFEGAASKLLLDLDLAVENVTAIAERRRGRVVIAAPPLLAATLLPEVIAELRRRYPGIQATVMDGRTDVITRAVRLGQADCGVGTFDIAADGVDRLPLARDSLMLFCPVDHALAQRERVEWADLSDEAVITLTRDSGIRLLVEVGFETAMVPFRPFNEVSHVTTALALVRAGLGVAVLPTYASAAAPLGKLVARPLTAPEIARDVVLIRPSGRAPMPAVLAVEAIVRREARRIMSWKDVASDQAE